MTRLRIAVRAFGAFEKNLAAAWADFPGRAGAELEVVPLGLEAHFAALFDEGGLRDGRFDAGFLVTDWLPMAAGDGHIRELSALAAARPPPGGLAAWPASLALHRAGGLWGLPVHDGPQCLIYRRDLLEAAGLAPPADWDAFAAAAQALTDPAAGRWGAVVAAFPDGHNTVYDLAAQVWSRGGALTGPAGPTIATPEAEAGMDFLRRLVRDSGAVHPAARETDSIRSGEVFAAGEAAMMANWFGYAVQAARGPLSGRIGVAPMPGGGAVLAYWVLAIGAGCRAPELAWDFLRHATAPEADRRLTLLGAVGCRSATWQDPEIRAALPFAGAVEALHAGARTLPADRRMPALVAVLNDAMAGAYGGTRPSGALLAEAQARAEALWRA